MSKKSNTKILLLNGPNLNLLGMREPDLYGHTSLADLEKSLKERAKSHAITLVTKQSNSEEALIEAVHAAKKDNIAAIIINPGAFTHTSIALRDAFLGTGIPFIEIHISNIYTRESFRHVSYLSDIAEGIIIGHGLFGYELALLSASKIAQSAVH